jgi:hypothetical protein
MNILRRIRLPTDALPSGASLLALYGSLAFACTAHAASYYVAKTGSDSNNGGADAPWLTIGHAARFVETGSTVNVGAGT